MYVKNENLKGTDLNFRGKVYTADAYGVFEVSRDVGALLLAMPGFGGSRTTKQTLAADRKLEAAAAALKQAQQAYDGAQRVASEAREAASRGEGDFMDAEDAADAKARAARRPSQVSPAAPVTAPTEAPGGEDEDEDEGESEELGEDEDEDEGEEGEADGEEKSESLADIAAGDTPNMRWKLDRLIRYANAMSPPIKAESAWSKAQVLEEIEARG